MNPLDVVQSFYSALDRGDVSAALSLLDSTVQWSEAEGFPYYSGTWSGPQAVLESHVTCGGRRVQPLCGRSFQASQFTGNA